MLGLMRIFGWQRVLLGWLALAVIRRLLRRRAESRRAGYAG